MEEQREHDSETLQDANEDVHQGELQVQGEGNPDVESHIYYKVQNVMLENDNVLIGKLVMNHEDAEKIVCLIDPMLVKMGTDMNTGDTIMAVRPWIPQSDDSYYFIPYEKVMNISTPSKHFLKVYADFAKRENDKEKDSKPPCNEHEIVNPDDVNLEDMIPTEKSVFH